MQTKIFLTKLLRKVRPGVLPMTPKQSDRVLNGLVRHLLGRRNFRGVEHKEFVPERKTVKAEFYKGVMDRLLKRIQGVRPAAFCCRDCFLLHDNAPAHKAASVCQFLIQKKMLQPFTTPLLSRLISARLFSVPQVENEVKRTPLCRCC